MADHESSKLAKLTIFLRAYGVITVILFSTLLAAFAVQTPLLADPIPGEAVGRFNWIIWNGVVCGAEPCHVPPMLFTIYIVWGVFFLLAARNPVAYVSFLNFTMWANLAHAAIMAVQTTMMMDRYWSKWLTDVPFTGFIALGIYLWRPTGREDAVRLPDRTTIRG
jgi:hypothetical protein